MEHNFQLLFNFQREFGAFSAVLPETDGFGCSDVLPRGVCRQNVELSLSSFFTPQVLHLHILEKDILTEHDLRSLVPSVKKECGSLLAAT